MHYNGSIGFGTHDNEGDVDFFPNGGEHQPGCTEDPGSSALYNLLHGGLSSYLSLFVAITVYRCILKLLVNILPWYIHYAHFVF